MALSVTQARPQQLTRTTSAQPGILGATRNALPGTASVTSNYGLQGYGPAGSSAQPLTISGGLRQVQQAASQGASAVDALYREDQAQQARVNALLASLRPAAPANIDIAAINAQARKQAEESVNPLYTKKLNDMLSRLAVQRQRGQQDYELITKSLDEQLKQSQDTAASERTRATEDQATATGQINTLEDQFQTASGQSFEDQRLAEASQLAAGGLTNSGIGRQQIARSQEQRNITEQQQGEDFQAQRTSQAVLKARTFEDLAKFEAESGTKATKGKEAERLNLDRLLEDITSDEQSGRFEIEQQRLGDLSSRVTDYSRSIFNNYLASIRDPRVFQATSQAYGGMF